MSNEITASTLAITVIQTLCSSSFVRSVVQTRDAIHPMLPSTTFISPIDDNQSANHSSPQTHCQRLSKTKTASYLKILKYNKQDKKKHNKRKTDSDKEANQKNLKGNRKKKRCFHY